MCFLFFFFGTIDYKLCWNRQIFLGDSMGFYAILCPRPSPAPEDSSCTVVQGYFSVVSRRFYPSEIYIMSQSLLSYLRIDTLSPSAPTSSPARALCQKKCVMRNAKTGADGSLQPLPIWSAHLVLHSLSSYFQKFSHTQCLCSERYAQRPVCPTGHGVHRPGRYSL